MSRFICLILTFVFLFSFCCVSFALEPFGEPIDITDVNNLGSPSVSGSASDTSTDMDVYINERVDDVNNKIDDINNSLDDFNNRLDELSISSDEINPPLDSVGDEDVLIGIELLSVAPITPSDSVGLKSLVLSLVGDYDPVIVEYRYQNPNNTYYSYLREVMPDYPWFASFIILTLVIYCIFRLGGALFCKW